MIRLKYTEHGSSSSAAVDAHIGSNSRLPPFQPSENPPRSGTLAVMLKVPDRYLRRDRHLALVWPSPSEEIITPILKRYKKKYRLEGFPYGYLGRFVTLLQRRLQCPEIKGTRCIFSDVNDFDQDAMELRSFDCIAIATTEGGRHWFGPKITEEQFHWLVHYFGGLPSWYYYFQPSSNGTYMYM